MAADASTGQTKVQRNMLTFFFLSQMFHNNKGQHGPSHQSCQNPENNPHHVVVVDPDHCANIVNLPIDGDLENGEQDTVII